MGNKNELELEASIIRKINDYYVDYYKNQDLPNYSNKLESLPIIKNIRDKFILNTKDRHSFNSNEFFSKKTELTVLEIYSYKTDKIKLTQNEFDLLFFNSDLFYITNEKRPIYKTILMHNFLTTTLEEDSPKLTNKHWSHLVNEIKNAKDNSDAFNLSVDFLPFLLSNLVYGRKQFDMNKEDFLFLINNHDFKKDDEILATILNIKKTNLDPNLFNENSIDIIFKKTNFKNESNSNKVDILVTYLYSYEFDESLFNISSKYFSFDNSILNKEQLFCLIDNSDLKAVYDKLNFNNKRTNGPKSQASKVLDEILIEKERFELEKKIISKPTNNKESVKNKI